MQCWAASLGDCAGPITKEHLATEALLGRRVTVERGRGNIPPVVSRPISIQRLTANILCEKHNGDLGKTADAAAKRLLSALRRSSDPMSLRGSRILRPPKPRVVSGVNFGRGCARHTATFGSQWGARLIRAT
jgi:hypothetical protein